MYTDTGSNCRYNKHYTLMNAHSLRDGSLWDASDGHHVVVPQHNKVVKPRQQALAFFNL